MPTLATASPRLRPLISDRRLSARSLILLAFVLLALPYAFAAPVFEKSDEVMHFAFLHHLANGGGLPVQTPAAKEAPWAQEGSQPPLYYALAALIIRPFDTTDFDAQRMPNASPLYDPYAPGNKNVLIITPEKRAFAYRNTTLAAIALRLLGILPGCVTVWLAFGIAHMVTRDRRTATVAMSLTAFNPMFLTVTTAVSNDGLLIALTTSALCVLLRALAEGVTWQRAAAFGILVGLASLTKVSGGLLLPLASALLFAPSRRADRLTVLAATAGPWLLIAGWWYARNLALYGDPTGTTMMAAIAHPRSISLGEALAEFEGLRLSYLAVFGHFNVPADGLVYLAFDATLIACVIGLIAHLIRRGRRLSVERGWMPGVLWAYVALTYAALIRWTMMTPASQGRLLFPCIAAISTLMAIGLCELAGARFVIGNRVIAPLVALPAAICGGLLALAAIAPFRYVIPAYTPPYLTALPDDMTPAQQRFGAFAEVVGYRMEPTYVRPGEKVLVGVAMRAWRATPNNYSLVVNLLGRDNRPLARFDTFTGNGLLPSSQWRPGEMWRDTVAFIVPQDAAAPATLRVQFALYNRGSGHIIPSYDGRGQPGAPVFDGATLLPAQAEQTAQGAPLAALDDVASLLAADFPAMATAGQPLTVTLTWRTLRPTPEAYTTFVHLVDRDGALQAQGDAPPLGGQFPTTRWQPGITFDDAYVVHLPAGLKAGRYRLVVGLYQADSQKRLAAFDSHGERLKDDSIHLGQVIIRP